MINSLLQFAVKHLGGVLVERLVAALSAKLTNWMVDRAIRSIDTNVETQDLERYYLLKEIAAAPKGEEGNEKRRILSITLARLMRGELPEPGSGGGSEV